MSPFATKIWKNICSWKQIKKFCEYIYRQLKYHQHRIKIKISISSKIILNVLKCLVVSLVPLKLLLWLKHHFCLFFSVSCLNLLWCQVCTFYYPLRKKRFIILPEGNDAQIQQHIHQKDLNLFLHHVTIPRLLLN